MKRSNSLSPILRLAFLLVFFYRWFWLIDDAVFYVGLPYSTGMTLFALFICYILAMFYTTIIHELGHLVFGLLTGYRFCSYRVFNFIFYKQNGRIRFGLYKLPCPAGQCLMQPPAIKDGKYPYLLYHLGGLIFNMIQLILVLVVRYHTEYYTYAHEFSFFFGSYVLYAILTNAIPFLAEIRNDGRNIMEARRNNAEREAMWYLLETHRLQQDGVSLKDMPDEWFPAPDDWDLSFHGGQVRALLACDRHLARHEFETYKNLLFKVLDHEHEISSPTQVHSIYTELLFSAILTGEEPRIIQLLRRSVPQEYRASMRQSTTMCRVTYAEALLVDQDQKAAEAARTAFEKALKDSISLDEIRLEQELMACVDQVVAERGVGVTEAET